MSSRVNYTQTLSKKYASSLFDYLILKSPTFSGVKIPMIDLLSKDFQIDSKFQRLENLNKEPFIRNSKFSLEVYNSLKVNPNFQYKLLSQVLLELQVLGSFVGGNKDVLNYFQDAGNSSAQKFKIIYPLVSKSHFVTQAFLQVLWERNHFDLLLPIIEEFNTLYSDYTCIKSLKVISRLPLTRESKKKLKAFLNAVYTTDLNPVNCILDFIISDSIFGGLTIVDGFSRIDLSFKNKIQQLLKTL